MILLTLMLAVVMVVSCSDEAVEDAQDNAPVVNKSTFPTTSMTIAGQKFVVELAITRSAREFGLMYRDSLASDRGMLFVFSRPIVRNFHMNNCLIDIDILFISETGTIEAIYTMKAPKAGQASRRYSSRKKVKYALELKAGVIKQLGLKVGETIDISKQIMKIIPESD